MKNYFDRLKELEKKLKDNNIYFENIKKQYDDKNILDDRLQVLYKRYCIYIILDKKDFKISLLINNYLIEKNIYKLDEVIKEVKKMIKLINKNISIKNDIINLGGVYFD